MIRSLRLRLLLGTSIASAIIFALLGLIVYAFMWHRLLTEFDAGQMIKARTVAAMVESTREGVTFDADLQQMPEFGLKRNAEYFEIWLDDGTVLAKSPSLGKGDLSKSASGPVWLPSQHKGRAVSLTFAIHVEHDDTTTQPATAAKSATVVLAGRPILVNHALDDLSWLLSIACSSAVVVCGVVLYRIVGRSIAPVNKLATEIESLNETDLSRRLTADRVPSELTPVVDKLNGLLARLDESFAREKAFTADVAHELRTPLAGIQTTLEVCRSRPREASVYESTLDECRGMTDRLQVMIENLLLLARVEAGQIPVRKQKIDLHQLMQECWLPLTRKIESKDLTVTGSNEGDTAVDLDVDKMRIVLRNLLDNAVTYTNESGSIRWTLSRSIKQIEMSIINSGSQISPAESPKLFDRFYRGDTSRTDTGNHCGLGLSLCQRLVTLAGGTIAVSTEMGGDFAVRIILPA